MRRDISALKAALNDRAKAVCSYLYPGRRSRKVGNVRELARKHAEEAAATDNQGNAKRGPIYEQASGRGKRPPSSTQCGSVRKAMTPIRNSLLISV